MNGEIEDDGDVTLHPKVARCNCPVDIPTATVNHRPGCPSKAKRNARGLPAMASPAAQIAIMASRRSPASAATLDFFPTPPFATRALIEDVLKRVGVWKRTDRAWDPCCGEGHMSEVLKEYYDDVFASDVHDYGKGYAIGNFPGAPGLLLADRIEHPSEPDFIFANPPFNLAEQFLERALQEAKFGCAFLLRTAWLEGQERYRSIFARTPPSIVAQFAERVTMVEGVWDPEISSATAYCWLLWLEGGAKAIDTRFLWIPPGAVSRHTKPDDVRRFAGISPRRAALQAQQ
jgi:hypothetical protein